MLRRKAMVPTTVGLLLLSGVAAAAPAAGPQIVEANLAYTCQFPAGPQPVAAQVTAAFPAGSTTSAPIQPEDVALTLTIPEATFTATTVTGTAQLTVSVAQETDSADAAWSGLEVPTTPIPETGGVVLTAVGEVPKVTVSEPGKATFTAAALDLELAPDLSAACTLDPDQDTQLAVVTVTEARASSSSKSPSSTSPTQPAPDGTIEIGPEGCFEIPTGVSNPTLGCGYMAGFTTVRKQKAAVLFGSPDPGFLQISYSESAQSGLPCDDRFPPPDDGYTSCTMQAIHSRATLDFPAADSSLLTFGFMPVAAKVKLTSTQDISIDSLQQTRRYATAPRFRYSLKVTVNGVMDLRLSEVTVNGVPLDVGPNCRTATPIAVVLDGGAADSNAPAPDEYTVPAGGVLTGFTEIPAFAGCGVSEDLDPLLTGTISGPDNYVKMTQGKPCFQIGGTVCPPTVPEPRR